MLTMVKVKSTSLLLNKKVIKFWPFSMLGPWQKSQMSPLSAALVQCNIMLWPDYSGAWTRASWSEPQTLPRPTQSPNKFYQSTIEYRGEIKRNGKRESIRISNLCSLIYLWIYSPSVIISISIKLYLIATLEIICKPIEKEDAMSLSLSLHRNQFHFHLIGLFDLASRKFFFFVILNLVTNRWWENE